MRTLLDVISLKDTALVKGSHGRLTDDPRRAAGDLSSEPDLLPRARSRPPPFKDIVLTHVFGRPH